MTWTQPTINGNPPPGLRGHTANLIGDKIYLFGGYDGKARSNDLYILDISHMKWMHPAESENAPAGRQRHSASLVGSKQLYIFGGFDGNRWLNDLHIFDIARLEEDALTGTAVRQLIGNMKTLLDDGEFSDITLVIEGREVKCHRNILAAQCGYFHRMFTGPMRESREDRIVIPDWSYEAFRGMLEFLYTGRMGQLDPVVVGEVLGLADQYALESLKSLCETSLVYSVDIENVCSVLKHADRYQAPELKKHCLSYIMKYSDILTTTDRINELVDNSVLMLEVMRMSLKKKDKKQEVAPVSTGDADAGGCDSSVLKEEPSA